MNPKFDPERYQRLRDEAVARALELRRRAMDEAWDLVATALRRAVARRALWKATPG